MTSQIPDVATYRGITYTITAAEGAGLFAPAEHGLEPRPLHTACWRGYFAVYAVTDRLLLDTLTTGAPDEAFGVRPQRNDRGEWVFAELARPMPFDGRLLLGAGHPENWRRPYLHMGFQPAWMFADVHELTFAGGLLTGEHDRSAEMAELRAAEPEAQPTSREEISGWVERTFSQSFDYAWPRKPPQAPPTSG